MVDHWEHWREQPYDDNRLLLLGESAYSWLDNEGNIVHPSPRHSTEIIEDALKGKRGRFTNMLTRGLTGCYAPTPAQVAAVWEMTAFTNYVPGTVGRGSRPTKEHWNLARETFPQLLADLAPRTVIVLGKTMWSHMPEADFYVTDVVQAYKIPSGGEATCWAVEHPARGLSWEKLARVIAYAQRRELVAWDAA